MIERNGWTLLIIPAVAQQDEMYQIGPKEGDVHHRLAGEVLLPDREPLSVLDETRRAIGTMNFAAQYQQDPIPAEGNVIKRAWLDYYDTEPANFDRTMLSCDLASTIEETSSYSVLQLWGAIGPDFYLLEVIREKLEAPELRRELIWAMQNWHPDATVVEDTELGRSMVQEIRRTTELRPLLQSPRLDKKARLLAEAPSFEARQVHLPHAAPWLVDFERELLAFPYGTYNDQVDATSQALSYLKGRSAQQRSLRRRNPVRREVTRR